MKILVDADACPVVGIIEEISKKYNLDVVLFYDTSHITHSDYSEIIVVDKGVDSVDYALISKVSIGDIVVSQDYGVGCMALSKKAYAINQYGREYTNENIDSLLETRALAKKIRMSSRKSHIKGPKKRTMEDDEAFKKAFIRLIERVIKDD